MKKIFVSTVDCPAAFDRSGEHNVRCSGSREKELLLKAPWRPVETQQLSSQHVCGCGPARGMPLNLACLQ